MKILCPIDSSTYFQAARRVAFQLARQLDGATLRGIHVVNVRPSSGNVLNDLPGHLGFEPAVVSDEVNAAHHEDAARLVNGFVADARAEGLEAEGSVVVGAVADELIGASHHADVVVMGLRGETDDRFPGQGGAQSESVLPKIAVPTLLVPREVTAIHSFAVGYDCSPSAKRALSMVKTLAAPLGASVHLIHVGDGSQAEAAFTEAEAELQGVQTQRHLVASDSVHEALVETATQAGADVLVLGFRGENTFRNVLFGSTRTYLLHADLRIALLVAR